MGLERISMRKCLLLMIEKRRSELDKNGKAGALLTDLSKAFDSINHNLKYV